MAHPITVTERIIESLRCTPDCRLDDLVVSCKNFPLQTVLSEVSRLSRVGQLQLTLISTGAFTLQLLNTNFQPRLVKNPCLEGGDHEKGTS
jgi:hypothetical protein